MINKFKIMNLILGLFFMAMNITYADFYHDALKIKAAASKQESVIKENEINREIEAERQHNILINGDPSIFALNKDWVVIVFFSSTCPHCKVFVPVIAQFIKDYGFQSQPYTLDGQPLEDFQRPVMANPKLINAFFGSGKFKYPAVFIVNNQTLEGIPISVGELTYEQVESRFHQVAEILQGQSGDKL